MYLSLCMSSCVYLFFLSVCEREKQAVNKVITVLSRTLADDSLLSKALIGATIIPYNVTHPPTEFTTYSITKIGVLKHVGI